jgi:hypothetical protein
MNHTFFFTKRAFELRAWIFGNKLDHMIICHRFHRGKTETFTKDNGTELQ